MPNFLLLFLIVLSSLSPSVFKLSHISKKISNIFSEKKSTLSMNPQSLNQYCSKINYNPLTMIIDLFISPCNYIRFLFLFCHISSTYKFRIAVSCCKVVPFVIVFFFILNNAYCPNVYFFL